MSRKNGFSHQHARVPGKPQFAKLLIRAFRRAGDQRRVSFSARDFALVFEEDGEKSAVANLANVYSRYCSEPPASRGDLVKQHVRALLHGQRPPPEEFADAKPDIFPALRSCGFLERAAMQNAVRDDEAAAVPRQQVGDHMAAVLVYDLPDTIAYLPQSLLDQWGVTFYEAMEAARENLAGMEFQVAALADVASTKSNSLAYVCKAEDFFASSRLLLLDVIRSLPVNGDYIVMAPSVDTLIVTGKDDEAGLAFMARQAEEAMGESDLLSAIPLRLVGDDWQTWMPERDDPLYQQFKSLATKTMGSEYRNQKELLIRAGGYEFVSEYTAVSHESRELISVCAWSEGVDSLLPKTDRVFFCRAKLGEGHVEIAGIMKWDEVQAAFGDLMEPQDMYPPRFRVREFPGEERLSKAAVNLNEFLPSGGGNK